MKRTFVAVAALLVATATSAFAQNTVRQPSRTSVDTYPKVELIPMAGYAWTMGMDVYTGLTPGELDFSDEVFYGGALDFNIAPPGSYKTAQLRLMYRRQDGEIELTGLGLGQRYTIDAAVEYWQIGGVTGIMKGNNMPFASVTLGGTHLINKGGSIGSSNVADSDNWKFSMIFGLGVKVYTSPKMGIMLQGSWPLTFTDTWGGMYLGTGGASVGISGTGISQLDVGGGLILRF